MLNPGLSILALTATMHFKPIRGRRGIRLEHHHPRGWVLDGGTFSVGRRWLVLFL